MEDGTLVELLSRLSNLSPVRKAALAEAINSGSSFADAVKLIEEKFSATPECAHCQSTHVRPWGHASGLRRYRCADCKRTFNALSGTLLAQLHRREAWLEFTQSIASGSSLRKAAEDCHIDLTTSARWKRRLGGMLPLASKHEPEREQSTVPGSSKAEAIDE